MIYSNTWYCYPSPKQRAAAELCLAAHSGNLTPPRISPGCPHWLCLWLGRGTIVGGSGHGETACQCCFGMDGNRSPSCWPSLMQVLPAQAGLGASSASLVPSQGRSADVIQSAGYSIFKVQAGSEKSPSLLSRVQQGVVRNFFQFSKSFFNFFMARSLR